MFGRLFVFMYIVQICFCDMLQNNIYVKIICILALTYQHLHAILKTVQKTERQQGREIPECQKRLKNLLILIKVTKIKKLGISKKPD